MTSAPDVFKIRENPPTPATLPVEEKERLVIHAFVEKGLTCSEIAFEYGLRPDFVLRVCKSAQVKRRALQIQEKVGHAIFKDKAPLMEAIADLGLMSLYEWANHFFRSGQHKHMSPKDAKALGDFVGKIDELWRLHVGKPTQITHHTIADVKMTLAEVMRQASAPPEQGGDPFVGAVDVEFQEVKNGTDAA